MKCRCLLLITAVIALFCAVNAHATTMTLYNTWISYTNGELDFIDESDPVTITFNEDSDLEISSYYIATYHYTDDAPVLIVITKIWYDNRDRAGGYVRHYQNGRKLFELIIGDGENPIYD